MHNPPKDAILLRALTEPSEPLVLDLPPFTGTYSACAKCRNKEALTWYRPANTSVFTEWNGRQQVRGPLPERLERQCQRCDFQWEEALVPAHGCAPSAEDTPDPDAEEVRLRDLFHALDDSCAYPLEIHSDALTFVATRLLERVRIYRRAEHPLWQPEEERLAATEPTPVPAEVLPCAQPAPTTAVMPLGQRQQPAPAGPTAHAQAAEA